MKHLFLIMMLLVAASASAQPVAPKVNVVFSPGFATNTLAAIEAYKKLDIKLDKRLLCARQRRCIDPQEFQVSQNDINNPVKALTSNVNVQLSNDAYKKWIAHLVREPGKEIEELLRLDLCRAFNAGVPTNNTRPLDPKDPFYAARKEPCAGIGIGVGP